MTKSTPVTDLSQWYLGRTEAMHEALSQIQAELNRLIAATGASAQDPLERIAELQGRITQLHGVAWDAVAADQRAVHEWTHRDPGAPWAPGNVGREQPVGLEEIADTLGVQRATADRWRTRKLLPEPTWTVSGRPLWKRGIIEDWARETGRMPGEDGE